MMARCAKHVILAFGCILGFTVPLNAVLYTCDGSTEYFELGSRVEVLCDNTTELLGVQWYRGDSEDEFLRLDQGVPGSETAEYKITEAGAMVIKDLQLSLEGLYRVTIVDKRGYPTEKTINIYAKVSLEQEPRAEQCRSSSSDWCTSVNEDQRRTTLVCYAKGTRPAVDLTWYTLSPLETTAYTVSYNTSVNESNSLYTSYSTLHYDPNAFILQSFTCNISGIAVEWPQQYSLYIDGQEELPSADSEVEDKNVTKNSDISLACHASSTDTLRRWEYVNPNEPVNVLRHTYPGNSSGPCYTKDRCYVNNDGELTITQVTHTDEGEYRCVYSDSTQTGMKTFNVKVVVNPIPMKTVIKGCDDNNHCDLNVALTGKVECSILGSRPAIKPTIESRDTGAEHVFLFNNDETITESSEAGAFDTKLVTEYEITECSSDVTLYCYASEQINGVDIPSSVVNLITDPSKCGESKGRAGLAAFLVIFFLVIIAAGIFIFIKRKFVRSKIDKYLGMRKERHQPEEGNSEEVLPMNPKKHLDKDKSEEFQPIYDTVASGKATASEFEQITEFCRKNEIEIPMRFLAGFLLSVPEEEEDSKLVIVLTFLLDHQPEEWMVLYQDMLYKLAADKKLSVLSYWNLLVKMLEENKIKVQRLVSVTEKCLTERIFTIELLKNKIEEYVGRNSINKSMDFLTTFCESRIFDEKELLGLSKAIFGDVPNQEMPQYLDLLYKLVDHKKISASNYISLVGVTYQNRKIDISKYIEVTGRCISKSIMTFDNVLSELKNFVDKRYCSREDFTDAILRYYLNNHVEEDVLVNEVCSHVDSSNQFVFPYFLHTVYKNIPEKSEFQENSEFEKLSQLFQKLEKKFLEKRAAYKGIMTKEIKEETKQVDLRYAFIQLILISNATKMINDDTSIEIIQSTKIEEVELESLIEHFVQKQTLETEGVTQLLSLALEKRMITGDFYVKMLIHLKEYKQLPFERYIELLKSATIEKLITEGCLEQQVIPKIKTKQWDKREWLSLAAELARSNSIGDSLRIQLFDSIIKHFKIDKETIEKVLMTKLGMKQDEMKAILKSVDMPMLPRGLQFGK